MLVVDNVGQLGLRHRFRQQRGSHRVHRLGHVPTLEILPGRLGLSLSLHLD